MIPPQAPSFLLPLKQPHTRPWSSEKAYKKAPLDEKWTIDEFVYAGNPIEIDRYLQEGGSAALMLKIIMEQHL